MNKTATDHKDARTNAHERPARVIGSPDMQTRVAPYAVLSRSLGNRALQRLLSARRLQAKLTVSSPDDVYEQEADRVADEVMRMPEPAAGGDGALSRRSPAIQRACTACEEDRRLQMWSTGQAGPLEPAWFDGVPFASNATPLRVQRREADTDAFAPATADHDLESSVSELQQGGMPLAGSERRFFESRFGAGFSDVRIHADDRADRVARAIHAEAFTVRHHVAFRSGRYAPGSTSGRRLLAHELTHVVQQTGASPLAGNSVQRTIGDGHDLASPRFSGNVTLEAAFDDELLVRRGAKGAPVRLIQESLVGMGYALPQSLLAGHMDGDFGPETEAAVTQFQRDAGAVHIDGIVGPETMGLLDTHDVSRPAARPPQITGPVPPPLGGGACDVPFAGVTFALAHQVAAGVANPADIREAVAGGHPFLTMRGRIPITHNPEVTINAPDDVTARQFRVGFVQNLLGSHRVADYALGGTVATIVPTLPIKDGSPADYHPIFVTNPNPHIVEDFGAAGATAVLNWPDVPGDGAFINLNDNPSCAAAGLPAQTMTQMTMRDTFRLWVVVQHRQSGCVRALHHVDWDLNWSARVFNILGFTLVVPTSNVNNVTVPDGDGTPRFTQGGSVPGEIAFKACI